MITQSIYLLATGPLSAGMIEQAAASDIIVDVLSFIVTERVVVGGLRVLAVQPLAVVFTSVNAVESVKEGLHGRVPGWKVYCISGATRQAVTDYFGAAAVEGTAESAGLLVELICRGEEAREISFFCGDHRREELPSVLRQAGFVVNERVVYRTLLTPHKTDRVYNGIAFFSPSAVESYFSVNTVAESTALFAIGRSTAATIKTWCSNPVVIGDQPEKDALIRKMIGYFSNKRRSQ